MGAGAASGQPAPAREPASRPGRLAEAETGQARLREVARGGTLNLVGAAVSAITTLGITVLVTRQFSRPVAGAFFTATSAFLIVEAVASLGANVGLVYFIARLRSLAEQHRIPAIFRAAVIPVLVASVALMAVMLLLASPLAHVLLSGHMGKGATSPTAVADALRALALTLPCAALLDTFIGASRGYRDMRPNAMVDKIGRSACQLLGVMIAVLAGSAALLAPLWALPYVPAAAVAWLWLRRTRTRKMPVSAALGDVPPELAALLALSTPLSSRLARQGPQRGSREYSPDARGFWRFTAPRGLASLASITLQRIDIVLVAIMRSPAEAAIYTAATRFLVAGQLGTMAISMAAQPRFTELFTVRRLWRASAVYQVTTAWLILLTWPLYLLAIAYGPQVLAIFGHSYRAGDAVIVILGLAQLLSAASGLVDMVLITTGRSSWSLFNGLLAVGVNVGVDLALIPRYGITGAAIGWAVAIVAANVVPLIQLAASVHLHPFGRGSMVASVLSAVSFCAVPFGLRALLGPGAVGLAAGVAAGCVVQAAGMWLFREPLQLMAMPGLSSLSGRWAGVLPKAKWPGARGVRGAQ